MKVIAELKDKQGETIRVVRYEPSLADQVMELFREGYPLSFDGNDLRLIKKITLHRPIDKTFLLAMTAEGRVCGCLTGLSKMEGLHRVYEMAYIYTLQEFRKRGILTILEAVAEEIIKDDARLILVINTRFLPEDILSLGWFKALGFELLGQVKYFFRDDLTGLFLGKRNPYFPIGKGIPQNSGWDETMADALTGKRISEKRYKRVMNDPGLAPKGKWGISLIGWI